MQQAPKGVQPLRRVVVVQHEHHRLRERLPQHPLQAVAPVRQGHQRVRRAQAARHRVAPHPAGHDLEVEVGQVDRVALARVVQQAHVEHSPVHPAAAPRRHGEGVQPQVGDRARERPAVPIRQAEVPDRRPLGAMGSPSPCRFRRSSPAPSVTRRQVEVDRPRPARRRSRSSARPNGSRAPARAVNDCTAGLWRPPSRPSVRSQGQCPPLATAAVAAGPAQSHLAVGGQQGTAQVVDELGGPAAVGAGDAAAKE